MQKIAGALAIIITLLIASCDGQTEKSEKTQYDSKVIRLKKPTQKQIARLIKKNNLKLKSDKIVISKTISATEECDGIDNNKNNFIDENCFGCFSNSIKADFNGDGQITVYDCSFPTLLAYSRTISKNSIDCADIDTDGVISIGDTLLCIEMAKGNTLVK